MNIFRFSHSRNLFSFCVVTAMRTIAFIMILLSSCFVLFFSSYGIVLVFNRSRSFIIARCWNCLNLINKIPQLSRHQLSSSFLSLSDLVLKVSSWKDHFFIPWIINNSQFQQFWPKLNVPFNREAMQKTINQRNFHWFTDVSSTSVRLICSFELRGPLLVFFVSDRKRQNRTAFVLDRRKSILNSDWS